MILTDETSYTIDQLAAIIASCLEEPYPHSDNLRTAAMQCPYVMTPAEWIVACARHDIHPGSARNRLREVRNFQREVGELRPHLI